MIRIIESPRDEWNSLFQEYPAKLIFSPDRKKVNYIINNKHKDEYEYHFMGNELSVFLKQFNLCPNHEHICYVKDEDDVDDIKKFLTS